MSLFSTLYHFIQKKMLSTQAGMWVAFGVLIGVAAGGGSLILYDLIRLITHYLLFFLTGFNPPLPGAEGGTGVYNLQISDRILIPVSTTIGGFVSGYMVYKLAPGTEGLGINAAINAFHNLSVKLKNRTPAVKLVSSAVIIGSGGSAGRDGPIAMISAVFGSFLANMFRLDDHDRRIVMASAIGAGFGSIFMAPIGGAIMSTEILYRKDFEVEALIPATIASVVGYAIFGYQFHYSELFSTAASSFIFVNAGSILVYAIIGLIAGLAGRFYVKFFDLVNLFFLRIRKLPIYVKPAIGGALVGILGMFYPEVLGLGYGWVQLILSGNLVYTPLYVLLILFFAKIAATSFSIGSGGSGGVFAPSIVTGAFLGASVGILLNPYFPSVTVAEITIITMLSLFAGVSKTPVSMLVMGTEMAGGLDMFLPLMIAVSIAYFVSGTKTSVYSAQVLDRLHSPAHIFEYRDNIMDNLKISDTMQKDFISVSEDTELNVLSFLMKSKNRTGAVVMDDGKLVGYITREMVQQYITSPKLKISEIMREKPVTISDLKSVHDAINLHSSDPEKSIVVVDNSNGEIRGTIGFNEIADAYEKAFKEYKIRQMSGASD